MKFMFQFMFLAFSLSVSAQNGPSNQNQFKVGDNAPKFQGVDQNNKSLNSIEILKSKEIVLIFYRGAWCGYCMKHLEAIQDKLTLIEAENAKVIVVSSEAPFSVEKTIEKTGATFSIIADTNNIILDAFGVSYIANEQTVPKYTEIVIKKATEGNHDETPVLPITSAYIIGENGQFKYVYFDTDYTKRADVDEIIEILNKD